MMNDTDPTIRHVVGVMTGTSIDGIDAALVRIEGRGLAMRAALIHHISRPLGHLGLPLRAVAGQKPATAGELAKLAWDFGHLHADVIAELIQQPMGALSLICVHGQTVFHQPPISWQLINPAPIAARFNCPVVFDLRQADLAAGGQGAPITPIADWILFRDEHKRRAIVNLGGFCNVTILPAAKTLPQRAGASWPAAALELSQIHGFDVCACNQILDEVARRVLAEPFDEDGVAAGRGRAKPQAAETLRRILTSQKSNNRSLGTGDEAMEWVGLQLANQVSPDDLAASAVAAIASCIGETLREASVDEIIVAGGGARNKTLVEAISRAAECVVQPSDTLGVPIEARESMAFAILGALCADGVPITLPQVTGCSTPAPIAGAWCHVGANRGLPPRG